MHLVCQKVQLSQVLMNLLNNSFDAIVDDEYKWIKIQSHQHGDRIGVSVTDSGNGIPGDIADQIFDPFYTTKGVGKGTGLGLSISAGILSNHGGRLYYDQCSPNTRFVMEFPLESGEV